MGLIRKTMSVSTMGVIKYRTPAQSARRNARLTRRHNRIQSAATSAGAKYQRQQVQLMQQQLAMQQQAMLPPQQQHFPGSPAGWYVDPYDPRFVRYWDGNQYTQHVQPR